MLHLEGREVGGCKLVRKIGEGGMGEVYLGEQIRVGNRSVAVKIVRADEDADDAKITELAKRFEREAALLGSFNHPNILPVHDSGVQGDLLYLVMQYAPDGSLADAIKGRTKHTLALPASAAFVSDLIGQVGAALQYTHERGVVHRDVKPGNVLLQLEPNGHWHALLADFGIARGADASSHRTQVSGTLAYMAPEQFSGKFSPASDQYALGVMTYQLLTGHTPFEGDMASMTKGHMYEAPPSVRSYNAALPGAVDGVLARALAKDPMQRFPSVAEYTKALQAALAQRGAVGDVLPPPLPVGAGAGGGRPGATPQWPGGPGGREKQPRTRGSGLGRVWLVLLAAVVVLVAIVGAGGYLVQQQQKQQASAQQTQAAQTASARPTLSPTANVTMTPEVTQIPTSTATPTGVGQDVTTPPAPPTGAGIAADPTLSNPSPVCGINPGDHWLKSSNLAPVACLHDGTDLKVQTQGSLACIQNQSFVQSDGYLTTIAQPVSGSVVLGFRQQAGKTVNGQVNVTGYYFLVDPATESYTLYGIDADGHSISITNGTGSVGGTLNKHFAVSVLYSGNQITLYINGISLATLTDTNFNTGWISLCTSNETIMSKVLFYPLAAS